MGRSFKNGLESFLLDTNTDNLIEFQIIEAKYGLIGYAIIIKLWQMTYGGNGYYCSFDELVATIKAAQWSCVKYPITKKDVQEVVSEIVKYGFYDKEIYQKYGVLTSKGVQRRYFEVAERRKRVDVENDYLLLSIPELPENVYINGINVNINRKNVDINSTRKEGRNGSNGMEGRGAPPTLEEIKDCVKDKNLKVNGEKFFYYYRAKGWDGISDWRSKLLEWNATERPEKEETSFAAYDLDDFERMLNEKE